MKRRALSFPGAVRPDASTMGFDNLPAKCQPQSGALNALALCRFTAMETLKQVSQFVSRDANAGAQHGKG